MFILFIWIYVKFHLNPLIFFTSHFVMMWHSISHEKINYHAVVECILLEGLKAINSWINFEKCNRILCLQLELQEWSNLNMLRWEGKCYVNKNTRTRRKIQDIINCWVRKRYLVKNAYHLCTLYFGMYEIIFYLHASESKQKKSGENTIFLIINQFLFQNNSRKLLKLVFYDAREFFMDNLQTGETMNYKKYWNFLNSLTKKNLFTLFEEKKNRIM